MEKVSAQGAGAELQRALKEKALALGFDAIQFTLPDSIPEAPARLRAFLEKNYHGDMGWLQAHEARRHSPENLWPEVKSVIMLGMNYGPQVNPIKKLETKQAGNISVYACGSDYHELIKKRLKQLGRWLLEQEAGQGQEIKVFVDTAPVMEKPLAAAAGMGWQGKHTNLVSRDFGSWLFLGSIFTTLEFTPDQPEQDHCGSCQACLDVCPTHAFPAPYQLDARKCISYLTIEARDQIPLIFREKMGNRIYGCDDCLAVCPWNKYAHAAKEAKLQAREELMSPSLADLVQLEDDGFRSLFSKSPVKRTGRARFVRNVLVAMGNAGQQSYVPLIKQRLEDSEPLVRGMAVWALGRYEDKDEMRKRGRAALKTEDDPSVQLEWERFLD